jgi:small subunit ribosomal protein S3Ae
MGKTQKGAAKGRKKVVDVMTRKEWYDVVAPAAFTGKRHCCKTVANKSQGNKLASDNLKGRVFEVNLADLMGDEAFNHRKIFLKVEDVQGRNCITNFYGMDLTTDKLRSLVKKWCTLIEGVLDVKTTDGYLIRLFCIAFTKKQQGQIKKNCHAQSNQVRRIRAKMFEIMRREIAKSDLQACVKKFTEETIGGDITKACNSIFPLRDVIIRKVKILKAPKFDVLRLVEHVHGDNIPASKEETATAL